MEFASQFADFNFAMGTGINTPTTFASSNQRLVEANKAANKGCGAHVLFMMISDETDEAAEKKWEFYKEGADVEALAWMADQGSKDTKADLNATAKAINLPGGVVNFNTGSLIGSHAKVAGMLDEIAEVQGTKGTMLIFDDFLVGLENFGTKIQPLMKSRADVVGV